MNKGAVGRVIFTNVGGKHAFIKLLGEAVQIWNIRIHSYSLRDTHYHLLVETPEGNLSRAMRHIDGVYTQRFNRGHQCDGALFRGRYKAILVDEENYLMEIVRYIHNQGVKAGEVTDPADDKWTSHRWYMYAKDMPTCLTTDCVLSRFARSKRAAKQAFDRYVKQGVPQKIEEQLSGKRWPSMLGSQKFKNWVLENWMGSDDFDPEISRGRAEKRVHTMDDIVDIVCGLCNCSRDALLSGRVGRGYIGRKVAMYLCRSELGFTHKEIGQMFCGLGYAAVAKIYKEIADRIDSGKDIELIVRTRERLKSLLKS
jgi:REP element-mobilizing transposase RayT